jgi:hypothetical protein
MINGANKRVILRVIHNHYNLLDSAYVLILCLSHIAPYSATDTSTLSFNLFHPDTLSSFLRKELSMIISIALSFQFG